MAYSKGDSDLCVPLRYGRGLSLALGLLATVAVALDVGGVVGCDDAISLLDSRRTGAELCRLGRCLRKVVWRDSLLSPACH